jgi:hypothetical protein
MTAVDYTLQLVVVFSAIVVMATVVVYERWVRDLRGALDRALVHAEEAQELLDAVIAVDDLEAAKQRHPSQFGGGNLRVIDGGA